MESKPIPAQFLTHRILLGILTAGSLFLAGCKDHGPAGTTTSETRPVTVLLLEERDFTRETRLTGSVDFYREQEIGFEVSGRLLAVLDVGFEVQGPVTDETGRVLRAGDVLAKLDDTRYRFEVRGLQARLNSSLKQLEARRIELERVAQANLTAAVARLRAMTNEVEAARQDVKAAEAARKLAAQTLDRQKRLMSKGAGRQQDVDDARSRYDRMVAGKARSLAAVQTQESFLDAQRAVVATAEASIALKQAEVESAEAQILEVKQALQRANEDLTDTLLRAPFSGRITRVHVTQGAVVSPNTPVVTLSLMDPIQVKVEVSADDDRRIQTGDRVHLYPKDPIDPKGRTTEIHAIVFEKGEVADPDTRTFRIDLMARNERRRIDQLDTRTAGLPVVQHILPVTRRYRGEGDNLYVETRAIYRTNGNAYVMRLPGHNLHSGGEHSVVGRNVPEKVRVILGDDYYNILTWTMRSLQDDGGLREGDILVINPKEEYLDGFAYGRPQWVLRPGDLVPVRFLLNRTPKGFYVPVDAITELDRKHVVYVVENQKAHLREVSVHDTYGELRRIEGEGLQPGVAVIVSGAHYVSHGEPVILLGEESL